MLFTKLYSLTGNEIENIKDDYKQSKHVGQYRISGTAVYLPDGGYIPVCEMSDIVSDKTSVHVSGCCAGGVPVERLVVTTGEKKHQLIFDSKKEVEKALMLINKKI